MRGYSIEELIIIVLEKSIDKKNESIYKYKNREIRNDIIYAIQHSIFTKGKIHYFFWRKRFKKRFTPKDYSTDLIIILNHFNMGYKLCNDAPKNGAEGNFIKYDSEKLRRKLRYQIKKYVLDNCT